MTGLLLLLVRAYQIFLSPFFGGHCRFYPSCSAYARESLQVHGAARGSWLALRRLSKCHPLGGAGVDLVPAALGSAHQCEKKARSNHPPAFVLGRTFGARKKSI